MNKMTAGQLTQIYTIATQQGCEQEDIQFLIEAGFMADFLAANWKEVDRSSFRKLGQLPVETKKKKFNVWKTIKVGTYGSGKEMEDALVKARIHVSGSALSILLGEDFPIVVGEREINLVRINISDLGLPGGGSRADVYKCAYGLGLKLCPAEVGPQLRTQYLDQPEKEQLNIGMETRSYCGNSHGFHVSHFEGIMMLNSVDYPHRGYFDERDGDWIFKL